MENAAWEIHAFPSNNIPFPSRYIREYETGCEYRKRRYAFDYSRLKITFIGSFFSFFFLEKERESMKSLVCSSDRYNISSILLAFIILLKLRELNRFLCFFYSFSYYYWILKLERYIIGKKIILFHSINGMNMVISVFCVRN